MKDIEVIKFIKQNSCMLKKIGITFVIPIILSLTEDALDDIISKDEIKQVVNSYIYYVVGFMKNEEETIGVE